MSTINEIKVESNGTCCGTAGGADSCCSPSSDNSACCGSTTGACC